MNDSSPNQNEMLSISTLNLIDDCLAQNVQASPFAGDLTEIVRSEDSSVHEELNESLNFPEKEYICDHCNKSCGSRDEIIII